jgi:hypothetical protein
MIVMRKLMVPALALLALGLIVGCGGSSKPKSTVPTGLTADQEQQLKEAQAAVDAAESQQARK